MNQTLSILILLISCTVADKVLMPDGCRCVEKGRQENDKLCEKFLCREDDIESNICKNRRELHSTHEGPNRLDDLFGHLMDDALCLRSNNSAVKDSFYSQADYDFPINVDSRTMDVRSEIAYVVNEEDGNYEYQDHVQFLYSNPIRSVYNAFPTKGMNGFCSHSFGIEFGVDIHYSCVRNVDVVADECERSLSIQHLIDNLNIMRRKTSSNSLPVLSSQAVSIEVSSVKDSTGNELALSTRTFLNEAGDCVNALGSLSVDIIIEKTGAISQVVVDVTTVEIISSSIGPTSVEQNYELQFNTVDGKRYADTVHHMEPGYQLGDTIPSGIIIDSSIASRSNLSSKYCFEEVKPFEFRFGESTVISCTLEFSSKELQDFCSSRDNQLLVNPTASESSELRVPIWMIQEDEVVGIFANADASDPDHWLEISKAYRNPGYAYKSRLWNPSQLSCNGMVTSSTYYIYYTKVGSVSSPVAKILKVEHRLEDDMALTHHSIAPDTKQKFVLQTKVSWIYVESTKDFATLSPPDLFSLPDDVFYPFSFSAGTKSSANFIISSTVILLTLLAL